MSYKHRHTGTAPVQHIVQLFSFILAMGLQSSRPSQEPKIVAQSVAEERVRLVFCRVRQAKLAFASSCQDATTKKFEGALQSSDQSMCFVDVCRVLTDAHTHIDTDRQTHTLTHARRPQSFAPGHACWLLRKADLPQMVSEWALASPTHCYDAFHSLAATDLTNLTIWGLTEASLAGGRGAYMKPAAASQLIVILLPGEVNTIQRVARSPQADPSMATDVLCDWIVSMIPKRCKFLAADDVVVFGLDMARVNRVVLT